MARADDILDARPTTPISNLMQDAEDHHTYSQLYRMACGAVRKFAGEVTDTVESHKLLFGKQSFCWTGEFRHWVWDLDDYRLFVNNTKGIGIEVPEGTTRDEAFDTMFSYLKTIGVKDILDSPLSGHSYADARNQGRGAIGDETNLIPRMDDDALREFITGICDGQIFTSSQVEPDMVPMVFMPLALGALQLPKDVLLRVTTKLPAHPGEKPDEPEVPEKGKGPSAPEEPKKPDPLVEDPEVIADIESRIGWQQATSAELDEYKNGIAAHNEELELAHEAAMTSWKADLETWKATCAAIDKTHATALNTYDEKVKRAAEALHRWEAAYAMHNVAFGAAMEVYHGDIGILWEYTRQAGPRSINGCPCFFSFRVMHREDWAKAHKAALAEMERRKNIPI